MYAEDFSASNEKWIPGVVQKVTGPLSYHIQFHDGRVIRRHIDNVKSRSTGRVEKEKDDNSEHNLPAMQDIANSSSFQRPGRREMNIASGCPMFMHLKHLFKEILSKMTASIYA